jgi:hypothetical protein
MRLGSTALVTGRAERRLAAILAADVAGYSRRDVRLFATGRTERPLLLSWQRGEAFFDPFSRNAR